MNSTTVSDTDDIDFILTMNPHGWSTCFIYVDGKSYELTITHVFNDPYEVFIQALISLMNGEKSAIFFWYGEPGGEKIEITRLDSQQDKVSVDVQRFRGKFNEANQVFEYIINFEIKFKSLLIISYMQLKKIFMLLKERSYAKERGGYFPFQKFAEYEKAVTVILNL